MATLAGPNYPAAAASLVDDPDPESILWVDPDYAREEGGPSEYAWCELDVAEYSRSLLLTDFGFEIPEGTWVANFLLEVKVYADYFGILFDRDHAGIVLVHDYGEEGGHLSTDRSSGVGYWPTGEDPFTWASVGGENEYPTSWFNDPLSAAVVNSSAFGVRLRAQNAGEVPNCAYITAVRLTAWYYEAAGGGLLSMLRTIGVPHTPGHRLFHKG